ncbi:MAG: hypothetical protein JWM11_4982 [Planctomycetaceae bacterium]|nr:hypothetical protein [Planctomycetaceae bacterium]
MLAAFAQRIEESAGHLPHSVPTFAFTAASTGKVMLRARSMRWLRKLLVISWSGYLIASTWWAPNSKLLACLLAIALLGTYRETFISNSQITWKLWLGFMLLGTWNCPLQCAQSVCPEWEEQGGMIEALLLGMWGLILAPLMDWLCPWRGGVFKLWIKGPLGMKILVWRGRSVRAFHSNHRLVQTVTGLPGPREVMNLSA